MVLGDLGAEVIKVMQAQLLFKFCFSYIASGIMSQKG